MHFRWLMVLLVLPLFLVTIATEPVSAIERNRKNLLKIQLKTDKKRGKSRIVMRLNQGGYYETEEDRENKKFVIKLFDFHNYGAQPIKVVNDPIVKGVNVTSQDQYLEIAVYLRVVNYSFKVSLFESPAMCVVDITVSEPTSEDKPQVEKSPSQESLKEADSDVVKPDPEKEGKARPTQSQLSLAVSKAVVKTEPSAPLKSEAAPEKHQETAELPAESGASAKQLQTEPPVVAETIADVEAETVPEAVTEIPVADRPLEGEVLPPEGEDNSAVKEPEPDLEVDKKVELKPETELVEPQPVAAPVAAIQPSTPSVEVQVSQPQPEVQLESGLEPELESKPEPQLETDRKVLSVLQPGQELFDQGLKAYQESDFIASEELFNQLVKEFPDSSLNVSAKFRRFDARVQAAIVDNGSRSRMAALIDEFLAAVRTHADHPDAHWALLQVARLYENMEFFYEASGVYKALLKSYPESPFATAASFALARLSFSLQRYDDAYDDFSDLLKRQPEGGFSVYAHYYRANALINLGQPEKALAEYRVGIDKDPDFLQRDPLSLYLLGSSYHRLQRYLEAKEYFLMMRNLFPNDKNTPQALAKIGEILVVEKNPTEAMLMFTTVVKEFSGSEGDIVSRLKMAILGENRVVRQELELLNENYAKFLDSEAAYLYLVEHHPESLFTGIARLNLGRLYYDRGEYENSRRILGQMLQRRLEPGLRDAAFTRLRKAIFAEIEEHYKGERFAEIVALQHEYRDDFLSRPGAVYPFLWVGEALHREGFETGALKVYKEVERLNPKPDQRQIINWGIVDLLMQLERIDEAEEFLGEIDFKQLDPLWRVRMLLLRAHMQEQRGLLGEAFATLSLVEKELPEAAIKERVEVNSLATDLWILEEKRELALDSLRLAATISFTNPQEITVDHRLLLGYRLARMLYEKKAYLEAYSWFSKLTFLAPTEEGAEIFYWQLRCQIGLAKGDAVTAILVRMETEFPSNPWTASAAIASKDFSWQQESDLLK
ncbi:tetratricopeptide repeat protein [bacterium]|nr:tetratricopeptide repeat protein [bacterium]